MTRFLKLCVVSLIVCGCETTLDFEEPIEYAIVRIPNTQTDKLLSVANRNWMVGVLEECSWEQTDKDLVSNYRFEIKRIGDSVFGQIVANTVFIMTERNEIIECQITENIAHDFKALFK